MRMAGFWQWVGHKLHPATLERPPIVELKMLKKLILSTALASLANVAIAAVEPVRDGVDSIDLGRGLRATTVLAHRENFNAHSFDLLTLYIRESSAAVRDKLEVVPFFDGKQQEHDSLGRSGGADCLLHDFRVLAPAVGHFANIVTAQRDPGGSFADSAPVTFTFYSLSENKDEEPGRPRYYFEASRTQRAAGNYCDVGEAFQSELSIGPTPAR